jgi:hypothetical protein
MFLQRSHFCAMLLLFKQEGEYTAPSTSLEAEEAYPDARSSIIVNVPFQYT